MTPAEYLAFDRASEVRHEYIDGEVVAMSGASLEHVQIAGNLFAALHARLRGAWRCRPLISDMRVRVADTALYTYPDVVVTCGKPRVEGTEVDVLVDPTLIAEVLSPSTEGYDRGEKWARYRAIDSLRAYLLIAQDRIRVELFVRNDDGTWTFSEHRDPGDVLRLEAIGCEIPLEEIYDGVFGGTAGQR